MNVTVNRFETNGLRAARHFGSKTPLYLLIVFGFVLATSAATPGNIYISQNSTGAGNGADCADALPVSWFNNSANWGSGTGQIGPGTTIHVCGNITGTAGSSGLVAQGSGTSSSPITIRFESGAVLQAPYWGGYPGGSCPPCGGAITLNRVDYIIVDGGSNGIIQNTANGTNLTYHHDSLGIYLNGSNIVVRNLTVQNIYSDAGSSPSATDTAGQMTADIRVDAGSSNISIYNNILNNARTGIWSDTSGANINYYNNTIADHAWQISLNGSGSPNVYNNEMSNWSNWFYPSSTYHLDGIIAYGNTTIITPYIYNNYIHGDFVGNPTGFIFCTYGVPGSGSGSSCTIFNNLLIGTGNTATNGMGIYFHSGNGTNALGPHYIYNNTLVGFEFMIYAEDDSTIKYTIENNIFVGNGTQWYLEGNGTSLSSLISDHNDFYGGRTYGPFSWGAVSNGRFSNWQAAGKDANGSIANPDLDATYHLQVNSTAIGLGVNLTGLNISALATGKPSIAGVNGTQDGVVRSLITLWWPVGAYPYTPTTTTGPPGPPQGLTATVN